MLSGETYVRTSASTGDCPSRLWLCVDKWCEGVRDCSQDADATFRNRLVDDLEPMFTALFTLEATLKVGNGVMHAFKRLCARRLGFTLDILPALTRKLHGWLLAGDRTGLVDEAPVLFARWVERDGLHGGHHVRSQLASVPSGTTTMRSLRSPRVTATQARPHLLTNSPSLQGANVSAVRSLRVLRPLRTLSLLPAMRHLINTMLAALPMLGNVILLSMFLFVVFGILGVQVCSLAPPRTLSPPVRWFRLTQAH